MNDDINQTDVKIALKLKEIDKEEDLKDRQALRSAKRESLIENERSRMELERDRNRWTTQYNLARVSFIAILVVGAYYLFFPIFADEHQAKVLSDLSTVVITLIGLLSSIVLAYIGATTYAGSKIKNSRKIEEEDEE